MSAPGHTWRTSVIADYTTDRPAHLGTPWALVDVDGPIPFPVRIAMWIAAWARAEFCPLNLIDAQLEPHCPYTPSDGLDLAVRRRMSDLVGSLFFAIPLLYDERRRPFAATWPVTWCVVGKHGRN